ncbi:MAG: DUF1599 domain-containing protein [Candidatus Aenigmatarchaeota archaeon]|nr:DUF1599 domain-containing protein [Nanoarchaeota archaeon]
MTEKTEDLFDRIVTECKEIFQNKMKDYGSSWLLFRLSSITDQIFIKAKRIRTIEEKGESKIPEGAEHELKGILNYCVMALIRIWHASELPESDSLLKDKEIKIDVDPSKMEELYDNVITRIRELLVKKNHDYGEAWRDMRVPSITDEILVKAYRVMEIDRKKEKLIASEDLDAQYSDIVNYCVFALIHLSEKNQ